jgi:hypothetical protein
MAYRDPQGGRVSAGNAEALGGYVSRGLARHMQRAGGREVHPTSPNRAAVHGAFFRDIRPVTTIVQVVRFIEPDWLLETEVDAVVQTDAA